MSDFYNQKFYMSYSGLNKLLYSPGLFYRHYILNQREDQLDDHLIEGKLIHCLLLDPDNFSKQFIIMPTNLPTGNTKTVIHKLWKSREGLTVDNLQSYSESILNTLTEMKLHQKLKTDQQRIDKIITEETQSYWEFLKVKKNKDVIDQETFDKCLEASSKIKEYPEVCDLLGLTPCSSCDVYNELELKCDTEFEFGLKGVLDNLKLNYDEKVIYINDLKTTSRTLDSFPDAIETYNLWAQASIYVKLIKSNFKELVEKEWTIKFTFIVIDKYQQVYPFLVSFPTLAKWYEKLKEKLKEAEWHYTNKDFTLPYKFATNQITL